MFVIIYLQSWANHSLKQYFGIDKLHWLPNAAFSQSVQDLFVDIQILACFSASVHPWFFRTPLASVSRRSTLRTALQPKFCLAQDYFLLLDQPTGTDFFKLKNAPSVNTFKQRPKTYLFQLSNFFNTGKHLYRAQQVKFIISNIVSLL